MKTFIHNTKIFLDQTDTFSKQSEYKYSKYEIHKKSIVFSKAFSKKSKKEYAVLLKLEQDIDSEEKFDQYDKTKNEFEKNISYYCRKCENSQQMFLLSIR